MGNINLYGGWIFILLGFLAGATSGLFFADEKWMGGYTSWRRRMTRLGHISFFGIGFINVLYALSIQSFTIPTSSLESYLLLIGLITMPTVIYLSAYRQPLRHLFPIPVLSLVIGVAAFIIRIL